MTMACSLLEPTRWRRLSVNALSSASAHEHGGGRTRRRKRRPLKTRLYRNHATIVELPSVKEKETQE